MASSEEKSSTKYCAGLAFSFGGFQNYEQFVCRVHKFLDLSSFKDGYGRMVKRRRTFRRRKRRQSTRRRNATKQWVKRNFGQTGRHTFATNVSDAQPGTLYTHTFNAITKGTDIGQRIGDTIKLKGYHVLWTFRNNLVTKRLFLRCIVVIDRKPQQGIAEDMFLSTSNTNNPVNWSSGGAISQMNYLINKQRYTVLYDNKWSVGPNSGNDGYKNMKLIRFYIPMKNKMITYNNDANAAIQQTPNIKALFWVGAQDSAPLFGTGDNCEFAITWRTYYEM